MDRASRGERAVVQCAPERARTAGRLCAASAGRRRDAAARRPLYLAGTALLPLLRLCPGSRARRRPAVAAPRWPRRREGSAPFGIRSDLAGGTMTHPLVQQLRFTRSEFKRGLDGVTDAEARQRFMPMNC